MKSYSDKSPSLKRMLKIAESLGLIYDYHNFPFQLNSYSPGYWQRSSGAWSFVIIDADNREVMGSCYPAGELWRRFRQGKKLETIGMEVM